MTALDEAFSQSRKRLFGLAYRMLGSAADAEDIVQETWLRAARAGGRVIDQPEAYLVAIATRLSVDHLRSARSQRELYVGAWLPEPIPDTEGLSPDAAAELADDLSFGLLMALEKLTPEERAAFLLHDVFDASFAVIAQALGRSEAACRQLASRARKALKGERTRKKASLEEHQALLLKFAEAVGIGDERALAALFTPDAVAYADGGSARAAAGAIRGADSIARHFIGLETKSWNFGPPSSAELAVINGRPGFLIHTGGALAQSITIETDGERITALYMVRDPEKLRAFAGRRPT
jgi:RNA polymerase sigma-70 factor (ECF subfamily)